MPHARDNRRAGVVRTDIDGNILDYDVVEQPVSLVGREKPASENRSRSLRQSPRVNRKEKYQEGEKELEAAAARVPVKKQRRDTDKMPKRRRRVRYVPSKSSVTIFEEKVDWNANAKIDTHNDEAIRRMHNAPMRKIFHEKLDWQVKPRIDTYNENALEHHRRSTSRTPVFSEHRNWNAEAKVNSRNGEFVENQRRAPKPQIYDEKLKWRANPKIDTHNEQAIERLKSAPKPVIYDEKFAWPSSPRIDHHNEEYIKHKEREQIMRQERKRVLSFPLERKPRPDRTSTDHLNPEFDEYKIRQKSARLPPIEDRKLEWKKTPRVNQRNDDYIERIRQKRSIFLIFREKLHWITKTPKIDDYNEEYVENLKERTRPKITGQLPQRKSPAKLDALNDSTSYEKRTIFNEKLRWHARPKIDTGLEPESDEDAV